MSDRKDFIDEKGSRVGRRAVLGAAAWSLPVIAVSVASPAHAASLGGGTLFIVGNAYANAGIYLAGTNYNGATAAQDYTTNAIRITIFLPEIDGIGDTLINASSAWTAFRVRNLVTIMNANTFPAGAQSGDIGNIEITGPFPAGSTYTITVAPADLDVVFNGNLSYTGTF